MSEVAPATVVPLTADGMLPAETTLRGVIELIATAPQPIFLVHRGSEHRAVTEHELRAAWHDDVASETWIWDLARAQSVASSVGVARGLLAERPDLECVLAQGDAGAFSRVDRVVATPKIAVVMAGGLGTRLRPLTDNLPKPLLDVGGRPLLAVILQLLQRHGIRQVYLSVHYLADKVRAFVGDGASFGLEVKYLEEKEPLGTGAGLALMPRVDGPFLVVNGDVLTNANLGALGRLHVLHENLVTVATCILPTQLKYGVVHCDGDRLVGIEEKPILRHAMNAGIYAFSADIANHVRPGVPLPMVPFLNELIGRGERVGRFALVEYWNDIGAHSDYERARSDIATLFPSSA